MQYVKCYTHERLANHNGRERNVKKVRPFDLDANWQVSNDLRNYHSRHPDYPTLVKEFGRNRVRLAIAATVGGTLTALTAGIRVLRPDSDVYKEAWELSSDLVKSFIEMTVSGTD